MAEPLRTIDSTPDEVPLEGPGTEETDTTRRTALDEVAAELTAEVEADRVTIPVPGRPGWAIVCHANIDGDTLGRWAKASSDKSQADGVNAVALASRIVAATNVAVMRNDEELAHNGDPVTLRSAKLLELLGVDRPIDGARKLFGVDGHLIQAGTRVTREAGYGDDLDAIAADPTVGSSAG